MIRRIPMLSMLSALLAGPAWGTTPIFSCDQFVPTGDTGILQNDLSCGGALGVTLGPGATLELNQHSISGAGDGVVCAGGRCTIEGQGEIAGSTRCAVTVQPAVGRVNVTVRDNVDIHDNACAIAGPNREDLSVSLTNVNVINNTSGISANRVRATEVTVTGNGSGGVFVRRAVTLRQSSVQNNGGMGVFSWLRARLRGTTVTGNDPINGFDVATHRKPRLLDSTCGKSAQAPEFPGFPDPGSPSWGVCLND